jgi:CRP-like cAMP-binding protein
MDWSLGSTAFFWGSFSALSLLLGAAVGLWLKPARKINAIFMAFGAGALLFALTIELFGHVPHHVEEHGISSLLAAICGALLGGILFDLLNNILNNRGAFLRNLCTARHYIGHLKITRKNKMVEELAKVEVLRYLPPHKMATLIRRTKRGHFNAGDKIFSQGDVPTDLYFICDGEVDILFHEEKIGTTRLLARLKSGDTFGEIGVLGDFPRTADAIAKTPLHVYRIGKEDIHEIIKDCPELNSALRDLSSERIESLEREKSKINVPWKERTQQILEQSPGSVSLDEIKEETIGAGGGAATAIWLGILLDGIPESLVIGMLSVSPSGMSLALIAGVFIANFPEAMSSAVGMKAQGMRLTKIYTMWGSIVLLTGIGAFIGATMFPAEPTGNLVFFVIAIEGLAAGAMLTMIAETMLPEAFEQGGSVIGLSTLAGFLSALTIKILAG